jgi:hypothetical protein
LPPPRFSQASHAIASNCARVTRVLVSVFVHTRNLPLARDLLH